MDKGGACCCNIRPGELKGMSDDDFNQMRSAFEATIAGEGTPKNTEGQ